MRARHPALIALIATSLASLASGSALYACSSTPGGPLGLIDRDDAAPPNESGAGSDTSTADTSPPEDAAEASAEMDTGAADADAAPDADADAATAD